MCVYLLYHKTVAYIRYVRITSIENEKADKHADHITKSNAIPTINHTSINDIKISINKQIFSIKIIKKAKAPGFNTNNK